MSAYIFNLTQVGYTQGDKVGIIQFDSEQPNSGFRTDDSIFLLDTQKINTHSFIGKGYINQTKTTELPPKWVTVRNEQKRIPQFRHKLLSQSITAFKQHNQLDDFTYSLARIYRYQNPIVQFRRAFTTLDEEDESTLQNEWIYVSRTVFGRLLNSLPRVNKLDFVRKSMYHFDTEDLRTVNYYDGLKLLKDYIEENILYRGKYLVSTRNYIKNELLGIISETNDLGFIISGKEESVSAQANLFDRVFELESVFNKVKEGLIATEKKYKSAEDHFKMLFRNSTWPIDLNKDE